MNTNHTDAHHLEQPAWNFEDVTYGAQQTVGSSTSFHKSGLDQIPNGHNSADLDFKLSEQLANVRPNHFAMPEIPKTGSAPMRSNGLSSSVAIYDPAGVSASLQSAANEAAQSEAAEQIGVDFIDMPGTIPIPQGLRYIPPTLPGQSKILVKSSIPPIENAKYIQECEAAAIASRLPPNHMSVLETSLMREHISHLQISTYVITRNAILRLWIKNPMIWVTVEEAQGVAREERHFLLCRQIWEFLVRNGYINFGCLALPDGAAPLRSGREVKQIVVIGAGVAGLSTARQLENLLYVFDDKLEYEYRITILEAKSRLGGRVYSHELASTSKQDPNSNVKGKVDLGAQIVTGFSGGNPLTVLLQRQLAIPTHSLVHARNNKIHGLRGRPIDSNEDAKVEGLFNLLLEAAARFRSFEEVTVTDATLRDTNLDVESRESKEDIVHSSPETGNLKPNTFLESAIVPVADKILGVSKSTGIEVAKAMAADPIVILQDLGFVLRGAGEMPAIQKSSSLGKTMSNILTAYASVVEISEVDRKILYWHWANMEYACGTNLDNLSLEHWDQDDGNEFRGNHAMIVGGYSQLVRGLALAPSRLDIRIDSPVSLIGEQGVVLATGEPLKADKIVSAVSLGVLKANSVEFTPTLPDWKTQAIEDLGFGLLNKVVLVFDEQFWDDDIDLLGTLPLEAQKEDAKPEDRGRFYMFWNCVAHANGRKVLIALMAGDAAISAESCKSDLLVAEARAILQRIYDQRVIPQPVETIVTQWGKDPHVRGSYSYIGPHGSGSDYEALARPVGQHWFFAGEATCRTHPSTVHGAYLSGLAAAKAVIESIIGEQAISSDIPLVPIKPKPTAYSSVKTETKKRKYETARDHGDSSSNQQENLRQAQKQRLALENDALAKLIQERIGLRPEQPKRTNANPFLIFQKDQWNKCRDIADEAQRKKLNSPDARASKNQIRACLGQTWRDTSELDRKPWVDIVNARRDEYETLKNAWVEQHARWERECAKITDEFNLGVKATSKNDDDNDQDIAPVSVDEQKAFTEEMPSDAQQGKVLDDISDDSNHLDEA